MENVVERVKKMALESIDARPDLFLVDVILKGGPGNQKLLIFIDGDNGVSIDDCSLVSRAVGAELEETNLIETKFSLEVSSPGLDFPITMKRQYQKNIGRNFEVVIKEGDKLTGKLVDVSDDEIVLQLNEENKKLVSFDEISKSKIEVSFK